MLEAIKKEVDYHMNRKHKGDARKITLAEYKKNNRVQMMGVEGHVQISADQDTDLFDKLARNQVPTDLNSGMIKKLQK
jgi:hypothetical protein